MATFRNGSTKAFGNKSQPSAPSTTTKVGRDEQSTVAIADSESVKTTEKGGRSTGLMVARVKGVNVISS